MNGLHEILISNNVLSQMSLTRHDSNKKQQEMIDRSKKPTNLNPMYSCDCGGPSLVRVRAIRLSFFLLDNTTFLLCSVKSWVC